VAFPSVRPGDRSTYKDFTILVDPQSFGLDAPALAQALSAEGVETRRYYAPPVHRTTAYRAAAGGVSLPVTDHAAARVLTLPLWVAMSDGTVDRVAEAIERIRRAG
jgi:dTDP-4-amino-4,6-dideoxygalactose transaminase